MRLVTFLQEGGTRLGVLVSQGGKETIIDLNRVNARIPPDIIRFLVMGAVARDLVQQALISAKPEHKLDPAMVKLQAPVPNPGKIICIGLNYRDHAAESNQPVPDYPAVFAKYANCVIGPGDAIIIPRVTDQVDYEAELAVVIGRSARHVSETEALKYVGGYVPFNDISARDYQTRTSQWTIGKIFDTFGPMGPALVTADEVPDPHTLDLRLVIGDEVLQNSNTRHLIFPIPYLIAYLSAVMTLDPGDIISTGTPAGVGIARTPPRFLKPGDVVKVEIDKLGTLENPVVAEA